MQSNLRSATSRLNNEEQIIYITIPPDGGFAWVIVICSFFTNFIVDGILYSYGKLLPYFVDDVHLSESQIAVINSVQYAMYYFVGPICSAFVNRYGFRVVSITGVLITSIAIFVSSYTFTFPMLIIFYGAIGGIGFGMIYAPSILIISFYFEKYRAIATGLAVCGSGFGTLIISALHSILLDAYGLQLTIQCQAFAVLSCAIFSLSYVPLKPVAITVIEDERRSSTEVSSLASTEIRSDRLSQIFVPQKTPNLMDAIKVPSSLSVITEKSKQPSIIKPSIRRLTVVDEGPSFKQYLKYCFKCKCFQCLCCKRKKEERPFRHHPLYKDDIFFAGNLAEVDEYKRMLSIDTLLVTNEDSKALPPRKRASVLYNLSITRAPIKRQKKNRLDIISTAITNALSLLLDKSLLKSYTFIAISTAGFISALGQYSTYVFITSRADANGMSKSESNWLIPMLGVSNLFGRIAAGFMSFLPTIDPSKITGLAFLISGIATIATGFRQYDPAIWQYLYCIVYGFTVAFNSSLKSVIYVQNLGLERLTNAFGLTSLIMGFGVLLGTPISGYLYELTGDYVAGFCVCGVFLIISGFNFIMIRKIKNWEAKLNADKVLKRVSFFQ